MEKFLLVWKFREKNMVRILQQLKETILKTQRHKISNVKNNNYKKIINIRW